MNDTPASGTTTNTVLVDPRFDRLRTLTYLSLSLNAIILLLIVIGLFHHHEAMERGEGGPGGYGPGRDGGCSCHMHRHHHHHHFERGGWGRGEMGRGAMMHRGGDQGPGPQQGGPGGGDDRHFGMMGRSPGNGGSFSRPEMGMGGMEHGSRTPPDPAKITDAMLDRLSQRLSLTDDEKAKIKPLMLEQATAMQKQMQDQRAAMEKQMADTKAKIRALLTPDQQKQFDALPTPGKGHDPGPPDGGKPGE